MKKGNKKYKGYQRSYSIPFISVNGSVVFYYNSHDVYVSTKTYMLGSVKKRQYFLIRN